MARTKPKYTPDPRVLDAYQVATRLGKSEGWFRDRRIKLEAIGFPRRDNFLGGWDIEAIERWIDLRSGIHSAASSASETDWMEALNGTG